MPKHYQLDFTLLPTFESATVWMSLPENVAGALKALPSTYDRAVGSLGFAYRVWGSGGKITVKEREASLRASLAEFVSMEEALQRDLCGSLHSVPKITDSSNPLLHMIRELRNLEIHLHSPTLTSARRNAVFAGEDIELEIWIADDITEAQFRELRNSRSYTDQDITKLVTWFNSAQKEWGIGDLIHRAVCGYSEVIIAKCGL